MLNYITLALIITTNLLADSRKEELSNIFKKSISAPQKKSTINKAFWDAIERKTSKKKVKLDQIVGDEDKSILNFLDQVRSKRGGDVGNGGDHISDQFYIEITKAIAELTKQFGEEFEFFNGLIVRFNGLKNNIDIDQIISQESISIKGIPHAKLNYFASEGHIIFNRSYFEKALREGKDLRQVFLSLLLEANNIEDSDNSKSKELYSYLETDPSIGAPLCLAQYENSGYTMIRESKKITGISSVDQIGPTVENYCAENGFEGYKITKSNYSGFGKGASHKVQFTAYKSVPNIRGEKSQTELCSELRSCLDLYEVAPFGQVELKDLKKLEKKVIRNCN